MAQHDGQRLAAAHNRTRRARKQHGGEGAESSRYVLHGVVHTIEHVRLLEDSRIGGRHKHNRCDAEHRNDAAARHEAGLPRQGAEARHACKGHARGVHSLADTGKHGGRAGAHSQDNPHIEAQKGEPQHQDGRHKLPRRKVESAGNLGGPNRLLPRQPHD